MRQLAWVKLFQWYAMFCYWQYIMLSLSTTIYGTTDQASQGFRDAGLLAGQVGAFYNFIAFVGALALVPFTRRYGPKIAQCLPALAGAAMSIRRFTRRRCCSCRWWASGWRGPASWAIRM
jgi:maltose/moltooligosaccharide transporter